MNHNSVRRRAGEVQDHVRVIGGRCEPESLTSTRPLMRRWIIKASPVSSVQTMYLPRRPMDVTVEPVKPSINAWRDVRRTVRSRPTSTRSMRRPTTNETSPRRTVSTSGNSGTTTSRRPARRTPRRPPAARPTSSTSPRPRPDAVPSTSTVALNVLEWSGPDSVNRYTGAVSYSRAVSSWSTRLVVQPVELAGGDLQAFAEQPRRPAPSRRRPHRRGTPHRARPRARRRGSTASAGHLRRPHPCRAAGTIPRPIDSATSASAVALTTLLRRSVSLPSGRSP